MAHGPTRKMKTLASSPQRNSSPLLCHSIFSSCIRALWESWLLNGLAELRVYVSYCVCECLSVVDGPLRKGVNPLILNQADVLAHHSLSSSPLLQGSLLLNPQPPAKCCSIFLPVCLALFLKPRKLSDVHLFCVLFTQTSVLNLNLPCLHNKVEGKISCFVYLFLPDRNLRH